MPRPTKSSTASTAYNSALSIHALNASVHLGVSKPERKKPQKIIVDIRFYLPSLLSSATSDTGDYICYHGISEQIHALCVKREYKLIEYLAMEIYRLIRKQTDPSVKIWLRLQKARILLPYVKGGTSFTYTDLPPFSWVAPQ